MALIGMAWVLFVIDLCVIIRCFLNDEDFPYLLIFAAIVLLYQIFGII